jgi:glycerol-3-phosphate cytidylyltransferase-like family protein
LTRRNITKRLLIKPIAQRKKRMECVSSLAWVSHEIALSLHTGIERLQRFFAPVD